MHSYTRLSWFLVSLTVACGGGEKVSKNSNDGVGGDTATGGSSSGTGGSSAGRGGSATGGANTGGSSTTGGSTTGGTGGGTPPDPVCGAPAADACAHNTTLPSNAPELEVGVWKLINPPDVRFGDAFTQGMAVDPCDSSIIYLTADSFDFERDNAGLYKSTDAGATWRRIGNTPGGMAPQLDEPIRVRVNPKNPQQLYVVDGVRGSTAGFWVSCDGGETFSTPESFNALSSQMFQYDLYDISVDPTDFDHFLITHHGAWGWEDHWMMNSGVLESKDGGQSWIVHEPQNGWGTGHAINFLYQPQKNIGDANTWLLGTQGSGMFRTTNAGESWTKVAEGGIQHGGGSIYYDKAGFLYASGVTSAYISKDNGATWDEILGGKGYNALGGDGETLYTAPGFGPAPYMVSPEGDGVNWREMSSQQVGQGPFEMVFDAPNNILYSANWGDGLYAMKVR